MAGLCAGTRLKERAGSSPIDPLAPHLRHDPADPDWPDRDRIATSLPIALGMALAERLLAARFGRSLVDHRTWTLLGADGLAGAAALEAAEAAGALGLERLCAIAPGATPFQLARCASLGWAVRPVPADDPAALEAACAGAQRARRPTLIALPPGHPPLSPDVGADAARGSTARRAWLRRLARHPARPAFDRGMAGATPIEGAARPLAPSPAAEMAQALPRLAPDWSSRPALPPQARAGALLGFALHRGVLPAALQPLADAPFMAPALRQAAAASLPLVLGFIEPAAACPVGGQRAALRAMANLLVFRPADAEEARLCLAIAARRGGPAALLLHETAVASGDPEARAGCAHGGYVAAEARGGRDCTLIASGAELATALAAREMLARQSVRAAVVSLPCWTLFAREPAAYRAAVLGPPPRFGLEAGSGFGWERWLEGGAFIGADATGAVNPADVCAAVLARVGTRPLAAVGRFN